MTYPITEFGAMRREMESWKTGGRAEVEFLHGFRASGKVRWEQGRLWVGLYYFDVRQGLIVMPTDLEAIVSYEPPGAQS